MSMHIEWVEAKSARAELDTQTDFMGNECEGLMLSGDDGVFITGTLDELRALVARMEAELDAEDGESE